MQWLISREPKKPNPNIILTYNVPLKNLISMNAMFKNCDRKDV